MEPRLAASVLAGALVRRAQAEGGFAAIIAKGDPDSGALLVILLEKGENPRLFERVLTAEGRYVFTESPRKTFDNGDEPGKLRQFLSRCREFDPDLWILELDIPSAERFAAEMVAVG